MLCNRSIEAAQDLYMNGRISKEEYWKTVEENERDITHWQTRTTETEKAAMQLALCVDLVGNIVGTWQHTDDEERKQLAENLFSEVIYDLDKREIVSFKLKPMYDRFLEVGPDLMDVQVAELYENEGEEVEYSEYDEPTAEALKAVWQDKMSSPRGAFKKD